MTYMEYKEVEVPEEVRKRVSELVKDGQDVAGALLSNSGFLDWLNKLTRRSGWRAVWSTLRFPVSIVLEREVERK